jgi:SAM-dependent methyltransferase
LTPSLRLLDLACGKGEFLCRWAERYGVQGVGVDISEVFLAAARARAAALGVTSQVTFQLGDASKVELEADAFDVACCIGATWIGGGLAGTVDLVRPTVHSDGLILIGEPFWLTEPPPAAYEALRCSPDDFTSLLGTCDRLAATGVELVEMVLADQDNWDRYVAAQWWTLSNYLRSHPDDPDEPALRDFLDHARWSYVAYGRQYLGWGVFVGRLLRRRASP